MSFASEAVCESPPLLWFLTSTDEAARRYLSFIIRPEETQHLIPSNGAHRFFTRAGCKANFARRRIVQARFIGARVEPWRECHDAALCSRIARREKQLAKVCHPCRRARPCRPRCPRRRPARLRRLPQRKYFLREGRQFADRFRCLRLALPVVHGAQGACGPAARQADAAEQPACGLAAIGRALRTPLAKIDVARDSIAPACRFSSMSKQSSCAPKHLIADSRTRFARQSLVVVFSTSFTSVPFSLVWAASAARRRMFWQGGRELRPH